MPVSMICQLKKKTESLNRIIMKKDLAETKGKPADEPIVILMNVAIACGMLCWGKKSKLVL